MLDFSEGFLATRIVWLIPFILSLSVHEWAHAFIAYSLGDDTAKSQGRLTLNPLVHIDPVGTFLLPMLGFPLAWAKPVPFNPARFDRKISMNLGSFLVAIAGPISNLLIALICFFSLNLIVEIFPQSSSQFISLFATLIFLNVLLAIFNMLPFPPLDGSYLVRAIVPSKWKLFWTYYPYLGPAILLALIFLPLFGFPSLLGDLFIWVIKYMPYSDAIGF